MSSTKNRKVKSKNNQNSTKTRHFVNKKIHRYFNYEEIGEIRTILKTKNLINVPFIIAATVLRKIPLIEQLIKDGYNINETGQNNTTALIWAVKYKFLDIVDFLIGNNADPAIETHNGDNILTIALNSKLWDEESFIELWQTIKKLQSININFTNKTGHNFVHMCVRRDWEEFLKILLTEQPDVNMANSNGVTPLMFACFRQNLKIVEALFSAGASPVEEDHHGRISLCYAISTKQTPNEIIDRVIEEIEKISSIDAYLKRRLELIVQTAEKGEISCSASGMLLRSIQFSIKYLKNCLEILLNNQIFSRLQSTIKPTNSTKCLEFIMKIINEILFYNRDSVGYHWNLHKKLLEQFSNSYITNICFDLLKSETPPKISRLCFKTLLLSTSHYQTEIFEKNATILQPYTENPALFDDESPNRKEILQEKLSIMKDICRKSFYNRRKSLGENRKKIENNSKQIKKRSKIYRNKSKYTKETIKCEWIEENPIVASFQHLLHHQQQIDNDGEPMEVNFENEFDSINRYPRELKIDENRLFQAIICLKYSKTFNVNTMKALDSIEDYFTKIIEIIIGKYLEIWRNEQQEQTPWCYQKPTRNIDNYKMQLLRELQTNFRQLLENLRKLAQQNLQYCYEQINQLENLLLNHKIHGVEIVCHTIRYKLFLLTSKIKSCPEFNDDQLIGDNITLDIIEINNSDELNDLKLTKNQYKNIESERNTMANSYHLIKSIISICHDDNCDLNE